jgi:hypothetical protein
VTPLGHQYLDFGDRSAGIKILGASARAIQNGMTSIESKRVFQRIQPFAGRFIPAVDDPAVRLQQCRWTQVPV